MKKLLMTAVICVLLAVSGCGKTTIEDAQPNNVSRFVVIESVSEWWVVADRGNESYVCCFKRRL